jgi:subtilisin family serine protease
MPHLIDPVYISRPLDVQALAENKDWGLESLKITPEIWDKTGAGEGVLYVVGDTGACPVSSHKDSKDPIFAENFTSASSVIDFHGHGAHVAGTVIAQRNDWGYVGIAYNAGYGALKLLGDNGGNTSDKIAKGYYWLAEWWKNRNAEMRAKFHTCVLNLSLGGPADPSDKKAIDALWEAGIIPVAAMGNSGNKSYEAPGIYSIGVAALDKRDKRASFSTYNEYVDVATPGVGIVSFGKNNSFVEMSGTSMASPNASGCIILILSSVRDPALRTHDGLIEYLSAKSPFDVEAPGKDTYTGLGKPNVDKAAISNLFNFGVA